MTSRPAAERADRPDQPDRIECEHADRCAGCPLIGSTYPAQLETKRSRVEGALARHPALGAVRTAPTEPAQPVVGYRTRAKLVVGPGGELGLYARGGGHEVVDIPGCRVLPAAASSVARALRARIATAARDGGVLAPATPHGPGALRAVDLREVRASESEPVEVLVTWVLDRARAPDHQALQTAARAFLRDVAGVRGVGANFQDAGAAQILGGETVHLAGLPTAPDRVGGSVHLATYGSFVQAHRGQAAKIHAAVAEAILRGAASPRVLDLYGGSGAIALGLAARGARVRLVESFAPAAAQARESALAARLPLEVDCSDAGRAAQALADAGEAFDAVVINPPRRGASSAVREGVGRLAARTVVYVSCDPDTLARDLDRLATLGYSASVVRPFDMIPLTDEVEAIAVLERGPLPPPRVLYEDDSVIVVDKGPHEPVRPGPQVAACLTDRVRRLPQGARATVVLDLETDASGIVVFARQEEHAAAWKKALASDKTRVELVVGARGILRSKGNVTRSIRGGLARIRYVRSAVFAGHSLARVTPRDAAGDLRVPLGAIGHPILGDDRSGDRATNRHFAEKAGLDRAFCHRARLEVDHPIEGRRLLVESPLAGDLQAVLDRCAPAPKTRP